MRRYIADFIGAEDGAVTVDWVVLTAGIIGLGMVVVAVVADGINDVADGTGAEIASTDVGYN